MFKDFGAVYGAACSGYASDENLDAIFGEGIDDTAPVSDLEGSDRRADGDKVEAEKAMAENERAFWCDVCQVCC